MNAMFEGFARQWTPLALSQSLTGRPRRIELAGTSLVAWRTPEGRPAVLLDRCPHRSVALSLGSLTPEGHLACGYHGWEFDPDGRCVHVPFNPSVGLGRLGAAALPTADAGGLTWVYTGFDPLGDPVWPEPLAADQPRIVHLEVWRCHWTRAMEIMLDSCHLPFVHAGPVGRMMMRRWSRDSVMRTPTVETDYGYSFVNQVDEFTPEGEVRWHQPNLVALETFSPPRQMWVNTWCLPIDDRRTQMIQIATRNFGHSRAAGLALERFNWAAFRQARRIVESSPPGPAPDPRLEQNVPSDRPMLTFRTWYRRELLHSSVPDPGGTIRPSEA